MSSDSGLADYICECLSLSCGCEVRSKKMFGEYAVYYREKVIGLICDNQLFIKPTNFGRSLLSDHELKSPYKGCNRLWILVEDYENRDLMQELIFGMYDELPFPKPKKRRKISLKSRISKNSLKFQNSSTEFGINDLEKRCSN